MVISYNCDIYVGGHHLYNLTNYNITFSISNMHIIASLIHSMQHSSMDWHFLVFHYLFCGLDFILHSFGEFMDLNNICMFLDFNKLWHKFVLIWHFITFISFTHLYLWFISLKSSLISICKILFWSLYYGILIFFKLYMIYIYIWSKKWTYLMFYINVG